MQQIGKHALMTMGWVLLLLYLLGVALRPTDNPTPAVAQSVLAPTPTALATTSPVTPAQVNRSVYLPVCLGL